MSLQFIDNFYKKEIRDGKDIIENDYICTIFKNENNKKNFKLIEEPKISYYIAKPDIKIDHNLRFIKKEDVNKVKCKYNELLYNIAVNTRMKDYYWDCIYNSNKRNELRKLHHINYIFDSNKDIEDYYKRKFLDKYGSKNTNITKAYFDIEVDSINIKGFPDEHLAPSPINVISLFLDQNSTMYIFILENKKNEKLNLFLDNKNKFKNKMLNKYSENGIKKIKIFNFKFEIDLIKKFFSIIHKYKPDFIMAWNSRFDIQTIINRIINLKNFPHEIICHNDFHKYPLLCDFYEDKKAQKISVRNDSFKSSNYSKFLDQMIIYAALRIGRGEKRSYKLNNISKDEIKDEKIDYTELGTIKTLPYENYELFLEYNMKDTLLLHLLEEKNQDISLMYLLSLMTFTRIEKVLRKTISLVNKFSYNLNKNGYIIGNNINDTKKKITINEDMDNKNEIE